MDWTDHCSGHLSAVSDYSLSNPQVPSEASSGPSHLEKTSLSPILQVQLESAPLPMASMMML